MISWPKEKFVERVGKTAERYERTYMGCSQCTVAALMEALGAKDKNLLKAAGALHSGMCVSSTCGVLTAGLMVLGTLAGRTRLDAGPAALAPIMKPAQEMVRRFREAVGSTTCGELSGVDWTDPEDVARFITTPAHEKCYSVVRRGAEAVAGVIWEAAAESGSASGPER